MGITVTSGSISFTGGITLFVPTEITDWGLVIEALTEGSENYGLITDVVDDTDDFGLVA